MTPTGPTTTLAEPAGAPRRADGSLAERFAAVRRRTDALCAPLSAEDHVVQPMPDASPAKWHLAHTSWFFEAFVLGGTPFDPAFDYLFNSYYEAVGPRVDRARRGMMSRPGLDRIHAYRAEVDRRMARVLVDGALDDEAVARLELGLHHEQQHQELILTDLKYMFGTQPLSPAYRALPRAAPAAPEAMAWASFSGGIVELGAGAAGFAFDNERPRHRVLLAPYQLATRPIANAEVLAFIADGGYRDHRLWLSDGWRTVQAERWDAPLYWALRDGEHVLYELAGVRPVDAGETACHLSLYEADAIARWLGGRLPTEAEWEHAAAAPAIRGNFADADRLHPERATATDRRSRIAGGGAPDGSAGGAGLHPREIDRRSRIAGGGAPDGSAGGAGGHPREIDRRSRIAGGGAPDGSAGGAGVHPREIDQLAQLYGDVWEWTASSYSPYPGFRPLAGALGEYNGKFMSGQHVLRGGSCLTPAGHVRRTYRNFFPPAARWQMTGIRVARDA